MLLPFLAQQDAASDTLTQYGAVGAIALICMVAVAKLFTNLLASHKAALERLEAAHKSEQERIEAAHKAAIARADAAYDKEVTRGDRLEGELRDLNRLVNDKLAGELVRATDAIREAWGNVHDQHRGRS